jgi:hypothetical protein
MGTMGKSEMNLMIRLLPKSVVAKISKHQINLPMHLKFSPKVFREKARHFESVFIALRETDECDL